jgi:hypothetical protein
LPIQVCSMPSCCDRTNASRQSARLTLGERRSQRSRSHESVNRALPLPPLPSSHPTCDARIARRSTLPGRDRIQAGSAPVLECYRRAEEARRMADAATSPFERADFLAIVQRWLSLARSPQLWSDPGCEDNDEAAEGCRRRSGRVLGSG